MAEYYAVLIKFLAKYNRNKHEYRIQKRIDEWLFFRHIQEHYKETYIYYKAPNSLCYMRKLSENKPDEPFDPNTLYHLCLMSDKDLALVGNSEDVFIFGLPLKQYKLVLQALQLTRRTFARELLNTIQEQRHDQLVRKAQHLNEILKSSMKRYSAVGQVTVSSFKAPFYVLQKHLNEDFWCLVDRRLERELRRARRRELYRQRKMQLAS